MGSSQPKAPFLSPQENKKKLSMARRMTIILHLTSQLLPVLVDILNYQVALKFLPNWKSLQRIIQVPLNSFELKKRNAQNCISLALIKPSNTDPNVALIKQPYNYEPTIFIALFSNQPTNGEQIKIRAL